MPSTATDPAHRTTSRAWHSDTAGPYAIGTYPTFLDDGTPNCLGIDTEIFFPPRGKVAPKQVQRICDACELHDACLEWAIGQGLWLQGVWAGTTTGQRNRIRDCRERRAAIGVCRHGTTCPHDSTPPPVQPEYLWRYIPGRNVKHAVPAGASVNALAVCGRGPVWYRAPDERWYADEAGLEAVRACARCAARLAMRTRQAARRRAREVA